MNFLTDSKYWYGGILCFTSPLPPLSNSDLRVKGLSAPLASLAGILKEENTMAGSIPSRETIRQNKNPTLKGFVPWVVWGSGDVGKDRVQRVYCGGETGRGSN